MFKLRFLSANTLKLLAALFMLIDHIGVFLFPEVEIFRYVGRLSFPIFAFMISEGAKYTKNKTNYVLGISSLALFCQVVIYYYDNKNLRMSILVTFTLSLLVIYALQNFKKELFDGNKQKALTAIWLFAITLLSVYVFTCFFSVDYGFIGVLTPVFASFFDFKDTCAPEKLKKLDRLYIRVLCMGIILLYFATVTVPYQHFSLLALPLLLIYSEKRGRINLKYFFYVFYPVHIFVLEGLSYVFNR